MNFLHERLEFECHPEAGAGMDIAKRAGSSRFHAGIWSEEMLDVEVLLVLPLASLGWLRLPGARTQALPDEQGATHPLYRPLAGPSGRAPARRQPLPALSLNRTAASSPRHPALARWRTLCTVEPRDALRWLPSRWTRGGGVATGREAFTPRPSFSRETLQPRPRFTRSTLKNVPTDEEGPLIG